MRLIDPGFGDIWDRLTVLELKRIFQQGFAEREYRELKIRLGEALSVCRAVTTEQKMLEVAQINALVWAREDAIRQLGLLGSLGVTQAGELAIGTRKLNDRKHALLEELNGYKEKLHGTSGEGFGFAGFQECPK